MRMVVLLLLFLLPFFSLAQEEPDSVYIGDTAISKEVFPYKGLTHYRISDTLDRSAPIDDELYERMFGQLKNTNWYKNGKISIPTTENDLYLLSSRSYDAESSDKADRSSERAPLNIITFLSEDQDSIFLYWLSFYSGSTSDNDKGDFGQFGTLASYVEGDTVTTRSYSELLNDTLLKRTTVQLNRSSSSTDGEKDPISHRDSTIRYLRIRYDGYDLPYRRLGEIEYQSKVVSDKDLTTYYVVSDKDLTTNYRLKNRDLSQVPLEYLNNILSKRRKELRITRSIKDTSLEEKWIDGFSPELGAFPYGSASFAIKGVYNKNGSYKLFEMLTKSHTEYIRRFFIWNGELFYAFEKEEMDFLPMLNGGFLVNRNLDTAITTYEARIFFEDGRPIKKELKGLEHVHEHDNMEWKRLKAKAEELKETVHSME